MDRVYNVEKSRKRTRTGPDVEDSTPKKRGRPKRSSNLESRYPLIQSNEPCDDVSQHQYMQAISKEIEKDKPRKDILLPLMKSTFGVRREYILNSDDSVFAKLVKYPALKTPSLVR